LWDSKHKSTQTCLRHYIDDFENGKPGYQQNPKDGCYVPRMEMLHHQDVMVELSTCLLAAQREIETLRIQLWNTDATI
jgi:hypothetical protein